MAVKLVVFGLENPGDIVCQLADCVTHQFLIRVFSHQQLPGNEKRGLLAGRKDDVANPLSANTDDPHHIGINRLYFLFYLAGKYLYPEIALESVLSCRHDGKHDLFECNSAVSHAYPPAQNVNLLPGEFYQTIRQAQASAK